MRPKGHLNGRTNALIRAITVADGEGLVEKLSFVSDNDTLPVRMRLDALKHLTGALHGRIRLNAAAKRHLASQFDLTTPED